MEILKGVMGESVFYSKLASTEASRKEKKKEERVNLARLAVTDQVAF